MRSLEIKTIMESIKIWTDYTANWKYNKELTSRERHNYSSRNMTRREKYSHEGLKYKRIWKNEKTGNVYYKELKLEKGR